VVAGVVASVKASTAAWRGRGDRVELRMLGIVRHSAELGTKVLAFADIARVEPFAHRVDVFDVDGTFLSLAAWDIGAEELAQAIDDRRLSVRWDDSDLDDTPVPSRRPPTAS
jgi:hypothetical protein